MGQGSSVSKFTFKRLFIILEIILHISSLFLYNKCDDTKIQLIAAIFLVITAFHVYLCIPKKVQENYQINVFYRIVKYYAITLLFIFSRIYIDSDIHEQVIGTIVFFIIIDCFRSVIYESLRYDYYKQTFNDLQKLVFIFEAEIRKMEGDESYKKCTEESVGKMFATCKPDFPRNYKHAFLYFCGKTKLNRIEFENEEKQNENYFESDNTNEFLFLKKSDLSINITSNRVREALWSFFTCYDERTIDFKSFIKIYKEILAERENISYSFATSESIFSYLNALLIAIEIFCTSWVGLFLLGIDTKFSSMFLSLIVFTAYPSIKQLIENFIMLIIKHPFDYGDRVFIDKENYIVERINFSTTEFRKWNGEHVVFSNTYLTNCIINNVKRSGAQKWEMMILVHRRAIEGIKRVEKEFCEYCSDFKKGIVSCLFVLVDLQDSNYLNFNIIVTHKANFQSGALMWTVHNIYMIKLQELLGTHGIKYYSMQKNLDMRDGNNIM